MIAKEGSIEFSLNEWLKFDQDRRELARCFEKVVRRMPHV